MHKKSDIYSNSQNAVMAMNIKCSLNCACRGISNPCMLSRNKAESHNGRKGDISKWWTQIAHTNQKNLWRGSDNNLCKAVAMPCNS
jgi:hypothetical protein